MALVQSANYQNNNWSQTTTQLAYSSANTAGNMLVAVVSGGGNDSSMSLSDSQGNTWVKVVEYFHDGFFTDIALWYCASCNGGSNTVTWTLGGWKQYRRMQIFEFSGMAASPFDDYDLFYGDMPTPGTDAIQSSGITPSQAGTLLFSFCMESYVADSGISAGTDYTQIQKSTIDYHMISIRQDYSSTSSITAKFTTTSNPGGDPYPQYVGVFVVFKNAASVAEITAAIQAKKSTISGSLYNISSIAGTVQSKKSTISGTVDNISSIAGSISAKKSQISGSIEHVNQIAGSLQAKRSTITGSLDNFISIAASIQAKKVQLSGASFIQYNQNEYDGSDDTRAAAFPNNNTAGNFLIAVISSYGTDINYTVEDTQGNTWYLANSYYYVAGETKIAVYYSPNCNAGANTVTVTLSVAQTFIRLAIFEYYGINNSDPLDNYREFYGNTPASGTDVLQTGNLTPTPEKQLLFASFQESGINQDSQATAGTGFNLRQKTINDFHLVTEDKFNTGTSPVQATFSLANGGIGSYVGIYAVFKIKTFLRSITATIQAKKSTISSLLDNIPSIAGSVQSKRSTISSTLNNVSGITAALQGKRAQISGELSHVITISAAIQSKRASISASLDNLSTITATVQGKRALISGNVTHGNTISAAIQAKKAVISSSLDLITQITGTVPSKRAQISGSVQNVAYISATMPAKRAQISGSVDNISSINSTMPAKRANVSGTVDNIISVSSTIQSKKSSLSGSISAANNINGTLSAKRSSVSSAVMSIATIYSTMPSKKASLSSEVKNISTITSIIYAKKATIHSEIGESFLVSGQSTLTIGLNCFYS